MRRFAALCLAVVVIALVSPRALAIFGTPRIPNLGAVNGGTKCAVCTLVTALVSQTMQLKSVTAEQAMDDICGYLPYSIVRDVCTLAVSLYGNDVAPMLNNHESPDAVCNAIGMCNSDSGTMCRLFPAPPPARRDQEAQRIAATKARRLNAKQPFGDSDICKWLPEVCQVENHLPAFDTDHDTYSTYESLRGTYWRGKDCDDLDATVFPGRESHDALLDSNCNGIYGVDPTTQQTYEDMWCQNTGSMGVAALGDSATAHFHLPPNYFNASALSNTTFANVLRLLENEADWPMLSWSTGHLNASSFAPDIEGPMGSVYSNMRQQNLCNHRDYVNLGVNGAASNKLEPFDLLLFRNRSTTTPVKPLLLIMSMIGNDVCNHQHDFSGMTTPSAYHANVVAALDKADTFLPNGSHVVLIPLVDGRILYDTMHDRIHPIGWTNKDVTYTDLYDYLNCLEVSPCWGWMNGNATVRNMTWEHAQAMNAQLPLIAQQSQGKYNNIHVHYLGNVFDDALNSFQGPRWELIEPVDGFHPSQLANALLGGYLFSAVQQAGILAPTNPNNAAILAKFGDQGGY